MDVKTRDISISEEAELLCAMLVFQKKPQMSAVISFAASESDLAG